MPTPHSCTTSRHRDLDLEVVAGTWPEDLAGEVLFSAPMLTGCIPSGLFEFGGIIRLALRPGTHGAPDGRFAWRVRSLDTPGKRLHDLRPDDFRATPVGYQSPYGPPNAANTAPLPWGDRLFATWDAGRPVELDPETLGFVGEVGGIDAWGPSTLLGDTVLPFLLSSAHPVVDPERHGLWTTKLDPVVDGATFAMAPSVVWWDGTGPEVSVWPLEGVTFEGSTHTVSQTRDWVVLCDSGNFRTDLGELLGGERTVTVGTDAPVWLVRKDELRGRPSGTPVTPRSFRVAPPNGHFSARYDDRDGISCVWEGLDLMDLALHLRADDVDLRGAPIDPASVGLYNMAMAPGTIQEVVFDPESGRVRERGAFRAEWGFNVQLSAMDWSVEGLSAPTLHHVAIQGCRPGRVSERAARLYEDRIDRSLLREETSGWLVSFERGSMEVRSRWEYPDTSELITSPAFVPRSPGSEPGASRHGGRRPGGHDGYVVQPVLSDGGFRVEVFDAAAVGSGPVAVLRAVDRACVPLLLHSAWRPTGSTLVDAERVSFADELTERRLAPLSEDQRRAVRQVAEDLRAG